MASEHREHADPGGQYNVRLTVEYDGSGFSGFQKQSRGRTVQGELERAVSALAGCPARVHGAGRTDAGVHARGQVVNFAMSPAVPVGRVTSALNQLLPRDVVVRDAAVVAPEFHARYSAVAREYEYTVLNRDLPSALEARFVWHVADALDGEAINEAAAVLTGRHDFGAFGAVERGRSPVRDVLVLDVRREEPYVRVRCVANAFLRHMARGIVGAIIDVGRAVATTGTLSRALSGERPALTIAPPEGLCLVSVMYDNEEVIAGDCTERV